MNVPISLAVTFFCVLAIVIAILFFKQLKGLFSLILSTIVGWLGLYIFNWIFAFSGFCIGINIASATTLGVLGIPGLLLLVILKIIYK